MGSSHLSFCLGKHEYLLGLVNFWTRCPASKNIYLDSGPLTKKEKMSETNLNNTAMPKLIWLSEGSPWRVRSTKHFSISLSSNGAGIIPNILGSEELNVLILLKCINKTILCHQYQLIKAKRGIDHKQLPQLKQS